MRILGLDYGARTCGVAVSDPLGLTAQGVETIVRTEENKLRRTLARIEELCSMYSVETIVLGLPLNMDGSEGIRAERARLFRDSLVRRTGLPVILQNECLTTVEAEETLNEAHVPRKDRKKVIDKMAAMVILQEYLDMNRMSPVQDENR